jgi:hypothetical protein
MEDFGAAHAGEEFSDQRSKKRHYIVDMSRICGSRSQVPPRGSWSELCHQHKNKMDSQIVL